MIWASRQIVLNQTCLARFGQATTVLVGAVSHPVTGIFTGAYQAEAHEGISFRGFAGTVDYLPEEFAVTGATEEDLIETAGQRFFIHSAETPGDGWTHCVLRKQHA